MLYLNKEFSVFTLNILGFVANHVPGLCSGEDIFLGHLPMTKQVTLSKGKLGNYVITLQRCCMQKIIDLKCTWQNYKIKKEVNPSFNIASNLY